MDKDKLLLWVDNVSYGVISTNSAMNKKNVRPFVQMYDEGDDVQIMDGTWSN